MSQNCAHYFAGCVDTDWRYLVHQHWWNKETPKNPNHFDWDCSFVFSFIFQFCNPSVFWITKVLICTRKQNPEGKKNSSPHLGNLGMTSGMTSLASFFLFVLHCRRYFFDMYMSITLVKSWSHPDDIQPMWISTEFFEFGKFLPFSVLLHCYVNRFYTDQIELKL